MRPGTASCTSSVSDDLDIVATRLHDGSDLLASVVDRDGAFPMARATKSTKATFTNPGALRSPNGRARAVMGGCYGKMGPWRFGAGLPLACGPHHDAKRTADDQHILDQSASGLADMVQRLLAGGECQVGQGNSCPHGHDTADPFTFLRSQRLPPLSPHS